MVNVSAVVPVYNVEKYIDDCIYSLQNQTLENIEIILVDDGSTDRSGEIIDKYASTDQRIKTIHKANAGVSAARNTGLMAASGEYVVFCDSDDIVELDGFEKLYDAGVKNGADVVVGDVYRIIKGEKKYAQFFSESFHTNERKMLDDLVRVDFSRKYCPNAPEGGPAFGYGGPWNKAVRREFLNRTGICFDESLQGIFDDILYTAYLYAEADMVAYIREPVYDYRIMDDSVTHSYKSEMIEINNAIFNAWGRFLNKYGDDGRFDEAYDALVIRRLKGTLGTYFFNEKNPASIKEQREQLKKLLKEKPYKDAIKKARPKKLINLYDFAVWIMANLHSVLGLQIVYKMFTILKKG